jgi:hypothetical protein
MLKSPQPPQPRVPDSADQKLMKTAQVLAGERNFIDPSVYRRRALRLWGRARDLVLTLSRREAAALLDQVAELINGNSAATPSSVSASTHSTRPGSLRAKGIADRNWMDRLLRGAIKTAEIESLAGIKEITLLLGQIKSGPLYQQKDRLSSWHISEASASEQSLITSRSVVSPPASISVYSVKAARRRYSREKSGLVAGWLKMRKYGRLYSHFFMSRRQLLILTEPPGEWRT